MATNYLTKLLQEVVFQRLHKMGMNLTKDTPDRYFYWSNFNYFTGVSYVDYKNHESKKWYNEIFTTKPKDVHAYLDSLPYTVCQILFTTYIKLKISE